MSRLEELIPIYGEHNDSLNSLKKVCDVESSQLKDIMAEENVSTLTAGGYKVTRSVSERETLDEAKVLEIVKKDWAERMGSMTCPFVKRVEVLDMEALEKALYAGEISEDVIVQLDACRSVKEVVSLRCTKVKGGKKDE